MCPPTKTNLTTQNCDLLLGSLSVLGCPPTDDICSFIPSKEFNSLSLGSYVTPGHRHCFTSKMPSPCRTWIPHQGQVQLLCSPQQRLPCNHPDFCPITQMHSTETRYYMTDLLRSEILVHLLGHESCGRTVPCLRSISQPFGADMRYAVHARPPFRVTQGALICLLAH